MATNDSRITENGESILDVDDAINLLLNGKEIDNCIIPDECDTYLEHAEQVLRRVAVIRKDSNEPFDDFHKRCSAEWLVPSKYMEIDIEDYLVERCETQFCVDRVMEELKLYEERGLIKLLNVMIYLVDFMREHKIIWGVGRGSSCSSFCLYLINIHRINSLKYKLDIREFLK